MTAGLPGSGLGGIFYFLSILVMLLKEFYLFLRKKRVPHKRRIAKKQFKLIIGMIFSFWISGLLFNLLISLFQKPAVQKIIGSHPAVSGSNIQKFFKLPISTLIISFSILGIILGTVELLRFVVKRNDQPAET